MQYISFYGDFAREYVSLYVVFAASPQSLEPLMGEFSLNAITVDLYSRAIIPSLFQTLEWEWSVPGEGLNPVEREKIFW